MWLFTSNAFLSIVADRNNKKNLLVRARFNGDIERTFGDLLLMKKLKVVETPLADYRFRVSIDRALVQNRLATLIGGIDYGNFKDSVEDKTRKSDLMRVWTVMRNAQEREADRMPTPLGDVSGYLDDLNFPAPGDYSDEEEWRPA